MTDEIKSSPTQLPRTQSSRGRPVVTDEKRRLMRQKIANIAKALFQEEGYAKISMRRIAREMGCSPMTLYKYYDAKIDILQTLWADVFDALFERLQSLPPTEQNDLQNLGQTYVQFWLEHTDYYRLVFMAEGVTQPEVSLFINTPTLLARYSLVSDAISEACSTPPSSTSLKIRLDSFICFLNGIAHNHITISGYPWSKPDDMVAMAVKAVTD